MLTINSISKKFRNTTALDNVSIRFPKKGIVFITGKSGCGKSTLLNILGGLERYDSGDIRINGKSSKDFKNQDWDYYRNTYIGFIFQDFNLIDDITVFDNVKLALNLQGSSDEKSNKLTNKLLKQVELYDKKDNLASELSGGQKQRVAIARALVKNPDIILADEPTGNLDSKTSTVILDILKEMSKDRLVIMVTHDTEYSEKYADRIIELKDGRILNDSLKNSNKKSKEIRVDKTQTNISNIIDLNSLENTTKDKLEPYLSKDDKYIVTSSNNDFISNQMKDNQSGNHAEIKSSSKKIVTELKKSKLPFKVVLNMVYNNLKIKKLRLLSTFVMFTISLSLFSLALLFATYDESNTYDRALDVIETKQFEFSTKTNNKGEVVGDVLTASDVEFLKEENSEAIFGYYLNYKIFPYMNFNSDQNTIYNEYGDDALIEYLRTTKSNVVVDDLSKLPVEIIEGTKSTNEVNSIIIPDFVADYVIHSGVFDLVPSDSDYSYLIGRHIYDLSSGSVISETRFYQIAGIYETNLNELFEDTVQNAEGKLRTQTIIMQYSVYVKTDYDPVTLFDKYDSAVFIDGSKELAIDLLNNYDTQVNTVLAEIDQLSSTFSTLSIVFIVALILFTIFAISLMYQFISIVIEHSKKEIGTLKALGTRSSDIFKIFFIEVLIVMAFVILGTLIIIFALLSMINGNISYKMGSTFNMLNLSFIIVLLIVCFSLLISFVSSYKPIRTITRLKPIEAIRNK